MSRDILQERFFESLIVGDRPGSRAIVDEAREQGQSAEHLIEELFWPVFEQIDKLYRTDQLSRLSHHMASRLLRVLVDQNATQLTFENRRGRQIFAICGPSETEELGAQMAVDMLEGSGFDVTFAGGGIANDEVLGTLNESQPDILLVFSSAAQDLPEIRELVDTLGEIGACRDLQIAVGGGVFGRAEGLAEEIGADIWAHSPMDIAHELIDFPERRAAPDQRTVGRHRRKRRAAA